ncbi:hypermethylated in cancer 2 protein-like [Anastrepha obliqua]|uniref:hypermethylated in cancer 2 protein-like n=1 Tax=Anastrepha obliqua TaxID=95512 RepID=UPI0024095FCC|nr:hypermethylated in cancer 2 protein-like [Anastrepha obliqua]
MNSSDEQILHDFAVIEQVVEGDSTTNLQEDDIQCGLIFYSETTRILKFFCTYCEKVSDNINYFCQHLSEHINDDGKEKVHEENITDTLSEDSGDDEDRRKSTSNSLVYEATRNQSILPCDLAGFDETKMVVEELDEAEEIAAEVEAEMRQELETDHLFPNEENSCSEDFFGYVQTDDCKTEKLLKEVQKKAEKSSTELKKKLGTDHHTSQSKTLSKRKKRVTTVKVIALKNRVAELYERIKLEEERRTRLCDINSEATDANGVTKVEQDSFIGTEADNSLQHESEPVRQIIGETVITLLPPTQSQVEIAKFAGNISPLVTQMYRRESPDDKTTCPACGRKFRSAFSLTIHKRTHYLESDSNVKLAHKCSDCDQLFNKIPDLKEHIQQVHYPDGFICKICNKKLTSLTLLETHMRKVHLSRPFNCEICRKNFDTRDRFEEHVKAHVSGQPYRCHICGRKYSTECILKQHLHRHKEQIPQCCVVCGKMTLRITQHMKIHAPRPKRVLSCKACGKVFNFSSGLSHHYKVMHKLSKPVSKFKREHSGEKSTNAEQVKIELDNSEETDRKENTEEINQKEEEAKRVIVELIQNATYTSFFPENFNNSMDSGPPIAREETISAVNSIVNEDNS